MVEVTEFQKFTLGMDDKSLSNLLAFIKAGGLIRSGGSLVIHYNYDKEIRIIEDGKPERKILYKK